MPRLVHFEIHASDPERLIGFYSAVCGWTFTKWEGPMDYWLITTGPNETPGINGGLVRRRGAPAAEGQPVNAFVCTVNVDALDATLAHAAAAGATMALPKMAVAGVGWLAYVKDPDGNLLGLMQTDPTAR
ncbi:MAG TPA: VOC family protein [Gemmatimonadales bacterium]|nr:VOC family protein [Gemmatimonadales bacterium]